MSIHRNQPDSKSGDKIGEPSASDDLYDEEISVLFQAESHRLKGYLARLGADWSLVDDIIQDSFLTARRRWPDIRYYKNPKSYLYKVATNRMRRLHRDRYIHTEPHADPIETSCIPVAENADLAEIIHTAIRALPRRQRETTLLHEIYGFSVTETADILQISEGSVKNYLCLGRRKLADLLNTSRETWEGEQR